jgi:hypothetical protein
LLSVASVDLTVAVRSTWKRLKPSLFGSQGGLDDRRQKVVHRGHPAVIGAVADGGGAERVGGSIDKDAVGAMLNIGDVPISRDR